MSKPELDREKDREMMMNYQVECIAGEYPRMISSKEDCLALDNLNKPIPLAIK